jgi:hypothetical protein
MRILKTVVIRIWPLIVGLVAFVVFSCVVHGDTVATATGNCLGPIIGLQQGLPAIQWIVILIAGVVMMASHVAWPRWYTAIISVAAAYLWCYMGMGAAGAGC